jgi:valyl-tRNA synthetase
MSFLQAFEKPFEPAEFEDSRSKYWIEQGFFTCQPRSDKRPFTIVIPPPNVTGDLHIGHVLNNTLQDILIRWQRLRGSAACWVPGTDHASIATEAKVTKMLKDRGIDKRELGREAFLQEAMKWKDEYGGRITTALKRMGASCDWSREVFTMDPQYSRAVLSAFVRLYNEGLVYKGKRLVNWCPVSQSVISDEEVLNQETQGHLWHIAYPLVGSPDGDSLVVATTRPETLFGDLALAVHPDDARYKHWIGQSVRVPVCNREIPVIEDSYVDSSFGTGVVKITPAHDPNDYVVGERHNLGLLNVMNPDASMNANVPAEYQNLDRYVARKKLVQELKESGLLVKTENHKMVIGLSERGNVPIEYYLSEQWYFKMDGFARLALDATREGHLKLYPHYTEKIWEHWLTNIKDWCVSRQLWWGHRIPVFTCVSCKKEWASVDVSGVCPSCGSEHVHQDEDVLDTWASSWLWPFAVQGWPAEDAETQEKLERFYPTETIVTGQDIIFFWIARMVMAGCHFTGKMPFRTVYFTPLVRDDKGRKMSKSLGNSPDLAQLIARYGTDALRFSLVNQIVLGQDIHWKDESCEMGRNFANKIWNATRFLLTHAERLGLDPTDCSYEQAAVPPDDPVAVWILSEFGQLVQVANDSLEGMQFSGYSSKIYEFFWMVYCDWFVELLKPRLAESASREQAAQMVRFALGIFDGSLRILHPLMPFLSEEIWQRLGSGRDGRTVGYEAWPSQPKSGVDAASVVQMRAVQAVVSSIRAIRGQYGLHPGLELSVVLDHVHQNSFGSHVPAMEFLSRSRIRFGGELPRVPGAALVSGVAVLVDLEGHVDPKTEVEQVRLRIKRIEAVQEGIRKKLSNPRFAEGAPAEIVAGARLQLDTAEKEQVLQQQVLTLLGQGAAYESKHAKGEN